MPREFKMTVVVPFEFCLFVNEVELFVFERIISCYQLTERYNFFLNVLSKTVYFGRIDCFPSYQ